MKTWRLQFIKGCHSVVAAFVGGECATNDEEQSSDFAIVAQEAIALKTALKQKFFFF